ncbi:hypothetical protein Taro_009581 [Colocasia esculenta]|uniref:GDSL esterase/lipase n=1 Tax=Colocasia esculenta TaxID=4460 RepID=A0A843U6X1_COLES|nr:hypothetical protein [Colocasia esculenta]
MGVYTCSSTMRESMARGDLRRPWTRTCALPVAGSASPRYASIISFGDSLADTGNFLLSGGGGLARRGQPHTLAIRRPPTEAFGLPMLPPYLEGLGQDFRQGVNFSVAGTMALHASFFQTKGIELLTNLSLRVQFHWFEDLKPCLCHSPKDCKDYLGRSLFLVGEIGGNDYNFPFTFMRSMEEVMSYVPLVVRAISSAVERLIKLGAVELLVPGNLAIGCNPIYLTLGGSPNASDYDPRNGCLKRFNGFSEYHNYALLKRELGVLRKKYPGARILYADYYMNLAFAWQLSPKPWVRFSNGALQACCGGGGPYNFNFSAFCGLPGSSVSGSPHTFVNWDGTHMTEAAYRDLAATLIKQLMAPS